jgi:hypothetical protein
MPGTEDTAAALAPQDTDATLITATATFRDHAGLWWRTYSEGDLDELSERPAPRRASWFCQMIRRLVQWMRPSTT